MANRLGFVYRAVEVPAARLRELIGAPELGWAWTASDMFESGRGQDLLQGHEGRAVRGGVEYRWRQRGEVYDVLALALAPLELAGFTAVGDAAGWETRPTGWRRPTQGAANAPATSFHAPDGAVQFIALIS